VERILLKINEKSSTDFEKKTGKNNFYKLKKIEKLKKEKSKKKLFS